MKPAKAAEARQPVRQRIVDQANELFYNKGYHSTGVREIVRSAGSAMSSFYDHFPAKEDLAIAYLEEQKAKTHAGLDALMQVYEHPRNFLRAWLVAKKKDIKARVFNGCPFAAFAYESGQIDPRHRDALDDIVAGWQSRLERYLQRAVDKGFLKAGADVSDMARQILVLYQGSVIMWRLSGDSRFIGQLEAGLLELVNQNEAAGHNAAAIDRAQP